jgi:hypothetical protein
MPQDGWWRESRLIPEAQRGAEWMVAFLPEDAAAQVRFPSPFDGLPAGATAVPENVVAPASADATTQDAPALPPGDAVPVPET